MFVVLLFSWFQPGLCLPQHNCEWQQGPQNLLFHFEKLSWGEWSSSSFEDWGCNSSSSSFWGSEGVSSQPESFEKNPTVKHEFGFAVRKGKDLHLQFNHWRVIFWLGLTLVSSGPSTIVTWKAVLKNYKFSVSCYSRKTCASWSRPTRR